MSNSPFDALAALRDTLPAGADTPVEQTPDATRPRKVSIAYERKGRGGKEATIICGLDDMSDDDLHVLATRLKQRLGTGGSARGGEILLQGDRRNILRQILPEFGLKF